MNAPINMIDNDIGNISFAITLPPKWIYLVSKNVNIMIAEMISSEFVMLTNAFISLFIFISSIVLNSAKGMIKLLITRVKNELTYRSNEELKIPIDRIESATKKDCKAYIFIEK